MNGIYRGLMGFTGSGGEVTVSHGCRQPYIVAALALKEAGYDVLILGTSDGEDMAKMLGGKCTTGGKG